MYQTKAFRDDTHGEVVSFTFAGEETAVRVVTTLVRESAWFDLTPLPDDEWRVTVKRDLAHVVENLF